MATNATYELSPIEAEMNYLHELREKVAKSEARLEQMVQEHEQVGISARQLLSVG